MDKILYFLNDFSNGELFVWFLLLFIYDIYIFGKVKKSLGKEIKSIYAINKNKRFISIILSVIIIAFMIIGILIFIKFSNPYLFIAFLLLFLHRLYYYKYYGSCINYSDKGFVYVNLNGFFLFEPIKWEDIKSISWDNDFGQKHYGFNIYLKNKKKLFKQWVLRKDKENINEIFRSYNIMIENY